MGTLGRVLQEMHDAGIGVSITWLWDARLDARLVHRSGVIATEGTVRGIGEVLCWLERVIKKHFPTANYDHTRATEMAHDSFSFVWRSEGNTARH
jgi:hypothetical protein